MVFCVSTNFAYVFAQFTYFFVMDNISKFLPTLWLDDLMKNFYCVSVSRLTLPLFQMHFCENLPSSFQPCVPSSKSKASLATHSPFLLGKNLSKCNSYVRENRKQKTENRETLVAVFYHFYHNFLYFTKSHLFGFLYVE